MDILALVASAALLVALGFQGWLLVHVRDQQNRVWARLDDLARRMAARPAVPAAAAANSQEAAVDRTNMLAGQAAPDFALAELSGGTVSLASLLAPAKPLLLIFTHPQCSPCFELLPDVGGWQRVYGDRLTIALVSSGEPRTNLAMTAEYGIRPVLLQKEWEVVEEYQLSMAPAAVVIDTDGKVVAGPRYGAVAIRRLVADTLGLAMPTKPESAVESVGIGKRAPAIRRPDLAGDVIDLGAQSGEQTLLLFWSPGCGPCRELTPEILAAEQALDRTRLVIVSRGPQPLSQEAGFASPIIFDDDHSISKAFGANGTPAAVLIDAMGIVASPVAGGGASVSNLLRHLRAAVPVAG